MLVSRVSRTVACAFLYLLMSLPAYSQASVQALEHRFSGSSGAVTLNLAELRLSRLPHAELKVVGGVVHPGMLNLKLDSDEIARKNDTLLVKSVEGSSEKKNDYLRITVAAKSGASTKLAFQLDKGALTAMDEAGLEQAIAAVLIVSGAAPDKAALPVSTAKVVEPVAPTAKPAEHSSTKIDLAPALPGYPPIHVNEPAKDGCWYEAFVSSRFNVEFAYPQCRPDSSMGFHVTVEDGPRGPVVKNIGMGPDAIDLFDVYAKRADETLTAAVKRVVINQMKDPQARLACKASPSTAVPGGKAVEVTASGPYLHHKAYPLGRMGLPCDGLLANDDTSNYFIDFPTENKEVFIEVEDSKGTLDIPFETVHFLPATAPANIAAVSSASQPMRKSIGEAPASRTSGQAVPPMKSIWLSQGRVPNRDLADQASAVVSFTHGFAFDTSRGDAIIAIACEKQGQSSPVLMLHALVPVYEGGQLANRNGQILIGRSKHNETLTVQVDSHFMDVAARLDQTDVAEMSSTLLAGEQMMSLSFFSGSGQDIAAGDLPAADGALDGVLNACGIATPARTVAKPERQLSASEINTLEIAKLRLGMSAAEAKQALGSSYQFLPGDGGKYRNLSFLLATDSSSRYGMMFFDNALKSFTFSKDFAPGSQPLAMNLINGLTEKTWLPLAGSSIADTSWTTDAEGIPITVATQRLHPTCSIIRLDGSRAPAPFNQVLTINLLDSGPDCGISLKLRVRQAQDKAMAKSMDLDVVDYRPIHALVSGVTIQQQNQKIEERKKAGQVASPF